MKGCISYWIGVKLYWVDDDICSHLALLFEQLFIFVVGWEVWWLCQNIYDGDSKNNADNN